MRFHCESSELCRGAQTAVRAVSDRPTSDIFSHVLIQADAEHNQVTLTFYDAEFGTRFVLPAEVEEAGEATAPAKLLSGLITDMPEARTTVTSDGGKNVNIQSGKSRFVLSSLSPSDYPLLPEVGNDLHFSMHAGDLRGIIDQTLFAVSEDPGRSALTGVSFSFNHDQLTAVSTDTHRLCIRHAVVPGVEGESQIIVPRRTLEQLMKCLGPNSEDSVDIRVARNQASFLCGDTIIGSRLVEGQFPQYERVIPSGYEKVLIVDREALLRALRRVLVMAREEKAYRVTIHGEESTVQLLCGTALGELYDEVPATIEGGKIDVVFNCNYLIDMLHVIHQKNVRMEFSGNLAPCVMKAEGDTDFSYVVMPMQPD